MQGNLVELPGWHEDISGVRSIEELPANAQSYLEFIEDYLGIPTVMVGVGPARDEMIRRAPRSSWGPPPPEPP